MNRFRALRALLSVAVLLALACAARASGAEWIKEDQAGALRKAKTENKLVLVDVWADWCGWCTKLDEDVFSRPEFAEAAKSFVLLKIDSDHHEGYLERMGQDSLPTTAFLKPDGSVFYSRAGYYYWEAYVAMLTTVSQYYRDKKTDRAALDAAVEEAIAAHPDPAIVAEREADSKQTKELLDAAGVTYTENEKGMFSVQVDGVDLYANVGGGLMSFQKWWKSTDAATLALYTKLLRANDQCAIGKFGVDSQGDVWLEQHVTLESLTGAAVSAYLTQLAALAKSYEAGGDVVALTDEPADVAAVRKLLTDAGYEPTEKGPGTLSVRIGEDDLTVLVRKRAVEIRIATQLPTFPDDAAKERCFGTLAGANYANYIGKFLLGADGTLSIGWGTLADGLTSTALGQYLEETHNLLLNYRAAMLAPAGAPGGQ
jgi:thioredoxin-related protein